MTKEETVFKIIKENLIKRPNDLESVLLKEIPDFKSLTFISEKTMTPVMIVKFKDETLYRYTISSAELIDFIK